MLPMLPMLPFGPRPGIPGSRTNGHWYGHWCASLQLPCHRPGCNQESATRRSPPGEWGPGEPHQENDETGCLRAYAAYAAYVDFGPPDANPGSRANYLDATKMASSRRSHPPYGTFGAPRKRPNAPRILPGGGFGHLPTLAGSGPRGALIFRFANKGHGVPALAPAV